MTQIKRSFRNDSLNLLANVETEWTLPADATYFESVILETERAGVPANARLSFEAGGTVERYLPLNPDYWTPDGTSLPESTSIYFLSEIDNEVKIMYAEK